MSKLVRRELQAGSFSEIDPDQPSDCLLIFCRTVGFDEQPVGPSADDFWCEAIAILDKHLRQVRRDIEGKWYSIFYLVGGEFET